MGKQDQGLTSSGDRYRVVPRVLVFLRNGDDVLLIKGAPTKRIWPNLYNGVGGHIEKGETIISAARREALEETGLVVHNLELKAVISVDAGQDRLGILIFVFTGWTDDRTTISSDEGQNYWISVSEIAGYDLVEDLTVLLPRVLKEESCTRPAFFSYHYDVADRLVIEED